MGKVFITGIGAISSLGANVAENMTSLRAGKSGISKALHFKSNYVETLPFAEINRSDVELREELGEDDKRLTRTTLIAIKAFREAIADAQLVPHELQSFDTGFISSSTVGGMCYTDELYSDANMLGETSDFVASYEGSNHTFIIAEKFGILGYTDTINTACSSSANAIMLGARLIQSGRAKRVIVGGADCLAKYTVNGFNSLRILSDKPCKPFDQNREGLTLGEAAAYLVLESDEICEHKRKYAEVSGFGNANDAFHPSATSDEARGPIAAMTEALKIAQLEPAQIDFINAHGTGTPNNDMTESYAFQQVFENVPLFSSTKSLTGHTLAAAGALEAIFSVLSLKHQEAYPSISIDTPIEGFAFTALQKYTPNLPMNHVMSNSFGFGGNCTSLILSRCI